MAILNLFICVITGLILCYVTFFDVKKGRFHFSAESSGSRSASHEIFVGFLN